LKIILEWHDDRINEDVHGLGNPDKNVGFQEAMGTTV
jgi:hypothetical protein